MRSKHFLHILDFLDIRLLLFKSFDSLLVLNMFHYPFHLKVLFFLQNPFSLFVKFFLSYRSIKACFKVRLAGFKEFFKFLTVFLLFLFFLLCEHLLNVLLFLKFVIFFFFYFVSKVIMSISNIIETLFLFARIFQSISLNISYQKLVTSF